MKISFDIMNTVLRTKCAWMSCENSRNTCQKLKNNIHGHQWKHEQTSAERTTKIICLEISNNFLFQKCRSPFSWTVWTRHGRVNFANRQDTRIFQGKAKVLIEMLFHWNFCVLPLRKVIRCVRMMYRIRQWLAH